MNPRLRRAIAAVGVLVFLTLYVWGVISPSPFIPEVWWAQLLYFGIAGTAWGVPILPLLTWAEKGGE
jgi:hypothetical protein